MIDKIKIKTGDVFEFTADALVFPANKNPVIGGSLDSQVYEKAGSDQLLQARNNHGELQSGEVCLTQSFGLNDRYKYLIHAASPVYQQDDKMESVKKLKECYFEALRLAEENQFKTMVFAILGAGANGFPYETAIKEAMTAIENYFSEHNDSQIKSVTLVKYSKESEYQILLEINNKLKEVNSLLSKIEGFETYIKKDSVIGKILVDVEEKLRNAVLEKSQNLYIQYQKEIDDYCNKTGETPEQYNYDIYRKIVVFPKEITNENLLPIIRESDPKRISGIRNLKIDKYDNESRVLNFLDDRLCVLKLGLALKLPFDSLCRLMWCRGHHFPSEQIDFDILTMYLPDNNYDEALEAVFEAIDQDKEDKEKTKKKKDEKKEKHNKDIER